MIGIGGSTSRPRPRWRPVRIVSLKPFAVHLPRPVSRSGVRLAVKLTPHGPANAVLVAAIETSQGSGWRGAAGIFTSAGWPDSARVMSGSGPLAPSTHGVWQSWQPEVDTMYLPRATGSAAARGIITAPNMKTADIDSMRRFILKPPWGVEVRGSSVR